MMYWTAAWCGWVVMWAEAWTITTGGIHCPLLFPWPKVWSQFQVQYPTIHITEEMSPRTAHMRPDAQAFYNQGLYAYLLARDG